MYFTKILKNYTTFIFRIEQSKKNFLPCKWVNNVSSTHVGNLLLTSQKNKGISIDKHEYYQ